MKNTLKLVFVSGIALILSACFMSEEDRIKDHRMKCEMYGFLPGTEQFASCVQKREMRYLNGSSENNSFVEDQAQTIAKEKNLKKQSRRNKSIGAARPVTHDRVMRTERQKSGHVKSGHQEGISAAQQKTEGARKEEQNQKRAAEESKRNQQEIEKKRQQEEQKKQQIEEARKHREAMKAAEESIGQKAAAPEETTPAGIGAQVPVTQSVPVEATPASR